MPAIGQGGEKELNWKNESENVRVKRSNRKRNSAESSGSQKSNPRKIPTLKVYDQVRSRAKSLISNETERRLVDATLIRRNLGTPASATER
jgi:hypothetical protein